VVWVDFHDEASWAISGWIRRPRRTLRGNLSLPGGLPHLNRLVGPIARKKRTQSPRKPYHARLDSGKTKPTQRLRASGRVGTAHHARSIMVGGAHPTKSWEKTNPIGSSRLTIICRGFFPRRSQSSRGVHAGPVLRDRWQVGRPYDPIPDAKLFEFPEFCFVSLSGSTRRFRCDHRFSPPPRPSPTRGEGGRRKRIPCFLVPSPLVGEG
jgi:hypothetical protein